MSSFRSRKPYSRLPANGQWLHDKAPRGTNGGVQASSVSKQLPAVKDVPQTKLMVSNLHYEITPKDLTAIFGQVGTLVREPLIRYDRSGRSSGVAIISFETPAEASKAKKQFDGILAKGQPMQITFDTFVPRSVSAPATSSLLKRIQKPPLWDRLGNDDTNMGSRSGTQKLPGLGPIRAQRGARLPRVKAKPKTAEELDKELDAFMGDSTQSDAPSEVKEGAQTTSQDVEMA